MSIRGKVSRSTLEKRDWHIYADFAQVLIHIAGALYINDKFKIELDNTVYALDSTTIDLCISLFLSAYGCGHDFANKKGQ